MITATAPGSGRAVGVLPLRSVVDDREEVVIARAGEESVVMISLEDYESLKESAYLLRSLGNARRLLASVERLKSGGGQAHEPLG